MPAEGRLWPSDDIQNGVQRGVFNHHFWLRYLELPEHHKTKTLVWSATLPDNWIPRWHGGAPLTSVVGCPPMKRAQFWFDFRAHLKPVHELYAAFKNFETNWMNQDDPRKIVLWRCLYLSLSMSSFLSFCWSGHASSSLKCLQDHKSIETLFGGVL